LIPFNVPPYLGCENEYIAEAINSHKLSGDGSFTKKCSELLEAQTFVKKALLTTSCTHALEMAAILCDIRPEDEVIMPSFTFVSSANAFVLRGATIVFVDIHPDTMNINESLIKEAVTDKTKAIVPVHYAGIGCNMDVIVDIAKNNNLCVIEDAAHTAGALYDGKPLGGIGDFGTLSFHETKNITCGEGGALLIRDEKYVERAEIIREKGTNRSKFFRGEVDKYTWCDLGSSFLPSELNAAYLCAQLEQIGHINENRLKAWNFYNENLSPLVESGKIETGILPEYCTHTAHMFWLKAKDLAERTELQAFLKSNGVHSVFHYVPLHSAPAGRKYGRFYGEDIFTTKESDRLLRLPLYYGITENETKKVVESVQRFYANK
jgi:dTDP-4-amino-4,6-dideoxygalactose transaminase